MGTAEGKSTVWIDAKKETVWNAITDEDQLLQWYAPGSPWKIPSLKIGEKNNFYVNAQRS